MLVKLTYSEILLGIHIAGQMQVQNWMQGRQARYGAVKDFGGALGIAATGVLGEMAVAKALDLFWMGNVGQHGITDVGGDNGVDVRTRTQLNHNLILHQADDDNKIFVGAIVHDPTEVRLIGWCYGHEGKRPEHWQTFTGRPCYFVPNDKLNPVEGLKDLLTAKRVGK